MRRRAVRDLAHARVTPGEAVRDAAHVAAPAAAIEVGLQVLTRIRVIRADVDRIDDTVTVRVPVVYRARGVGAFGEVVEPNPVVERRRVLERPEGAERHREAHAARLAGPQVAEVPADRAARKRAAARRRHEARPRWNRIAQYDREGDPCAEVAVVDRERDAGARRRGGRALHDGDVRLTERRRAGRLEQRVQKKPCAL